MAEHVDKLSNSHKKQALANQRKRQFEPGEFPDELNDRKRSKCDYYERWLQIKSAIVGTDLKLECECTCNIECSKECMLKCMGTQQWIGGQNETVLTYNNHAVDTSRDIQILEQSAHKNSIIIRNPTLADLISIYTCSSGTLSKSTSLDEYNEHESCLQIKTYIVGTNLILECVCTCNKECMGNKQWTGGQNETALAYNSHVVDNMNIAIPEQTNHEYSMIINNATQADLESNYTCSVGKHSKSISLPVTGYNEQSAQASPTVPDVTATGGSNVTTVVSLDLDIEIGVLIAGYFLASVLVAVIVFVIIYEWNTWRRQQREQNAEEEIHDLT